MTEEKKKPEFVPGAEAGTNFADDYARQTAEKLIEAMKAGTSPYQTPWSAKGFMPYNPVTGRPYQGVNALRLLMENRKSAAWLTMRQVNALGGRVMKGEHGVKCFFYAKRDVTREQYEKTRGRKEAERAENEGRGFTLFVPCPFTVFSIEQTTGLDAEKIAPVKAALRPIDRADQLLEASGAAIENIRGNKSCYSPASDSITLPLREQFADNASYYDTALHELAHWTGHPGRLARFEPGALPAFGTPEYAREELRAETASLMIASSIGLPHHLQHHASYVSAWIKLLQDDPKEIFRACAEAEKITDFVMQFDRERLYVLDYEKHTVIRTDRASFAKKAKRLIDAKHLSPAGYESYIEFAKEKLGLKRPEAELRAMQKFLAPEENSERLLSSGVLGYAVSALPGDIFVAAAAAGPEYRSTAERFISRTLGEAGKAEAENFIRSEDGRRALESLSEVKAHIAAVRSRFPGPEEKFVRASDAERSKILGESRRIVSGSPAAGILRAEAAERGKSRETVCARAAPERAR